jgi:3-hydroxyisobutyrate dehydrogenase-like beta-hydroxyacid dehydrogenase
LVKIGFIGLGKQGKFLARNLVTAGHDVVVYDVNKEPVEELKALGAAAGASLRELANRSEIIAICVRDDAQLLNVLGGPEGVIAGAMAGSIIAVHSTVSPKMIADMADIARARGVDLIDAPVSGGEQGAIARTMSYMVGGSEETVARCRPLFEASGTKITHTGAVGSAIHAKLVHQAIICGNMLATAEGMRLGLAAGLSKDVLQKVIHEGAGQSWIADHWFQLDLRGHAIPVFYKDLQLCLAFAHEMGIAAPGIALTQQLLEDIIP